MTPIQLLETTYLGDRACEAVSLEGWDRQVVVHVDVISRVRSETGSWDFYTAEDIPDGRIVFAGVQRVRFEPTGPIPNDLINSLEVSKVVESSAGEPVYVFELSVGSLGDDGSTTEVIVEIEARDLYLQDPRSPTTEIRE